MRGGRSRHSPRVVPILPVHSLQRSEAFYRALGFGVQLYPEGGYAFACREGCELHLREAPDLAAGQNPAGAYFYLAAQQAKLWETEFREAGIPILSPLADREWKMREFMLSDPDGNLLRFGESLDT